MPFNIAAALKVRKIYAPIVTCSAMVACLFADGTAQHTDVLQRCLLPSRAALASVLVLPPMVEFVALDSHRPHFACFVTAAAEFTMIMPEEQTAI